MAHDGGFKLLVQLNLHWLCVSLKHLKVQHLFFFFSLKQKSSGILSKPSGDLQGRKMKPDLQFLQRPLEASERESIPTEPDIKTSDLTAETNRTEPTLRRQKQGGFHYGKISVSDFVSYFLVCFVQQLSSSSPLIVSQSRHFSSLFCYL